MTTSAQLLSSGAQVMALLCPLTMIAYAITRFTVVLAYAVLAAITRDSIPQPAQTRCALCSYSARTLVRQNLCPRLAY